MINSLNDPLAWSNEVRPVGYDSPCSTNLFNRDVSQTHVCFKKLVMELMWSLKLAAWRGAKIKSNFVWGFDMPYSRPIIWVCPNLEGIGLLISGKSYRKPRVFKGKYFIQRFPINFPTSSVRWQDLRGCADPSLRWSLLQWLVAFRRKRTWNLENLPKNHLDEDFSIWQSYFLWAGWVDVTSGQSFQDVLVTKWS